MADWDSITFGKFSMKEVLLCTGQSRWQRFRKSLRGLSIDEKFSKLNSWLRMRNRSHCSKVQVTNYVNALRRAGQVPPSKEEKT